MATTKRQSRAVYGCLVAGHFFILFNIIIYYFFETQCIQSPTIYIIYGTLWPWLRCAASLPQWATAWLCQVAERRFDFPRRCGQARWRSRWCQNPSTSPSGPWSPSADRQMPTNYAIGDSWNSYIHIKQGQIQEFVKWGGGISPLSLPLPLSIASHSPLEVVPLKPARRIWGHCKLPQRGSGRSPGQKRIWCTLKATGGNNFIFWVQCWH